MWKVHTKPVFFPAGLSFVKLVWSDTAFNLHLSFLSCYNLVNSLTFRENG